MEGSSKKCPTVFVKEEKLWLGNRSYCSIYMTYRQFSGSGVVPTLNGVILVSSDAPPFPFADQFFFVFAKRFPSYVIHVQRLFFCHSPLSVVVKPNVMWLPSELLRLLAVLDPSSLGTVNQWPNPTRSLGDIYSGALPGTPVQ